MYSNIFFSMCLSPQTFCLYFNIFCFGHWAILNLVNTRVACLLNCFCTYAINTFRPYAKRKLNHQNFSVCLLCMFRLIVIVYVVVWKGLRDTWIWKSGVSQILNEDFFLIVFLVIVIVVKKQTVFIVSRKGYYSTCSQSWALTESKVTLLVL